MNKFPSKLLKIAYKKFIDNIELHSKEDIKFVINCIFPKIATLPNTSTDLCNRFISYCHLELFRRELGFELPIDAKEICERNLCIHVNQIGHSIILHSHDTGNDSYDIISEEFDFNITIFEEKLYNFISNNNILL